MDGERPAFHPSSQTFAGNRLAAHGQDFLVFETAGRRYGLPGAAVAEVLRAVLIVPLPQSSPLLEGVINVRGTIIPVLALRLWLGLPEKPVELSDHLIVARVDALRVVLRVDRVVSLVHLETEPDADPAGVKEEVRCVKLGDGLLVLPDLRALLAASELRAGLAGAASSFKETSS